MTDHGEQPPPSRCDHADLARSDHPNQREISTRGRHDRKVGITVAQALGFDVGELAGQEQPLGPDDEVVREAHDRQPDLVVLEGSERQVAHPRVFVVADVVLDTGAGAVITLKRSDRPGLIGEDRLEAMTVVVGEGQLRAGMRALAADNHSRAPRPGG